MNEENERRDLPEEVVENLRAYAERIGKTLEEVKQDFLDFLHDEFGIEDWREEEEELIKDLNENFQVAERRNRGGSGTVAFVGHFVGMDAKWTDRRINLRETAKKAAMSNLDAAIQAGRCGLYTAVNGKWMLETKNGKKETDEDVVEGRLPECGFRAGDYTITLVTQNENSDRYMEPFPHTLESRYYYFLGNAEGKFEDEILLWRVEATGETKNTEVRLGVPCSVQVRPPRENAAEGWGDVLGTFSNWPESIDYSDEFADPDMRSELRAHRFWCDPDFHELYAAPDELAEAYEAGKRHIKGRGGRDDGWIGPIVLTKGIVVNMSTEPMESEYDQTGRNFAITLSSSALISRFGEGVQSEISCWIPGAVADLLHPFEFHDGAGWVEYAERSQVLVCGRVGLRPRDEGFVPKLNVLGIVGINKRCRRREKGGNTSLSQF